MKLKTEIRILPESIATIVILLVCLATVQAQEPPATDANMLFQAQKWSDAAWAYEQIIKTEPANGRAWFRLGVSLHKLGEYDRAVTAYQQALNKMPETAKSLAMYNLGASYAKLRDNDKSFEWLGKAISAGYSQTDQLRIDPDLQILREDKARFEGLLETADRLAKPCLYQAEHKQFDFWIGEWNVQNAQGQAVGTSRIERIESGCIILENWSDVQGGTGKSLNFYDANLHKWRQTWADNVGGVSEFSGEYKDGAIRYEGESHTPDGTKILRRLTFFNLGPDKVRQYSEASMDDGKTWHSNYDFTYIRKH